MKTHVMIMVAGILGGCMTDMEPDESTISEETMRTDTPRGTCFIARPNRPAGDCKRHRQDLVTDLTQAQCAQMSYSLIANLSPEIVASQCALQWEPLPPPSGSILWLDLCWEDGVTRALSHTGYGQRICP